MNLKWTKNMGQPVDSGDGLKYLSIIWLIVGTSPKSESLPFRWRISYYIYSATINTICSLFFTGTMLVNLFFINSFKDLVDNLSLSFSIAVAIVKQLAILKHRNLLLKSTLFLKFSDQRSDRHMHDRKQIFSAIRYSQLFALHFPFYVFCGCGFGYNGWRNHQLIYNSWIPNFFSNPEDNYLAMFIYQFISQIYIGLLCVFNDTFPLCYVTLMIGHLQSLNARISRIGWTKLIPHSQEQINQELKDCIKEHKNLLTYFDCISPLISITMFTQFVITAGVLCLTAINLTFFSHNFNEQFFELIYLIILLIQIFPCCWLVNQLMDKTDSLTTAMYSCNWMDQKVQFRKMLIIFMQRSQKTNAVMAGDLAPVTLQTFIAIIRFSFSMFTIISKM